MNLTYDKQKYEKRQKDILVLIAKALQVKQEEISGLTSIKKGMTNHSFLFECEGKKYMIRVPGEGTDRLINRRAEAEVYQIRITDIKSRKIWSRPECAIRRIWKMSANV